MEEKIRRVLLDHWDPLGIRENPSARDEYDEQARMLAGWLGATSRPTIADLRQFLDDEAYRLSPTWDDDAAIERTAEMLVDLQTKA